MHVNKIHRVLHRQYHVDKELPTVTLTDAPLPPALEQVAIRARLALRDMTPGDKCFVEGCLVERTEARRGSQWIVRNQRGSIEQTIDYIVSIVDEREVAK